MTTKNIINKSRYHHGSSSKYLCKIHLIFATKYRKQLLKGVVEEDMKQILFEISLKLDFTIDVMESHIDHIHILIDYPPKLSISSIVNRLKRYQQEESTRKTKCF